MLSSSQKQKQKQKHFLEVVVDLSNIQDEALLARTEKLAQTERKVTHLVLWHINEIECRRLHASLGYSSMHEYLVKHLRYADGSAYRRLQSARLLRKIPELAVRLEEGSLNLTQMVRVNTCLNKDKKSGVPIDIEKAVEVFDLISSKNSYDTEKVLAVEFNQPIQMHEVVKPQRDDSVRLELSFTPFQMAELKKAKDSLSHVLPDSNWAEVIFHLAMKQNQKLEVKPAKAAAKVVIRDASATVKTVTPSFTTTAKRKSIKITTRRKLLVNANHCCEYVDSKSGRRCAGTYQLQIDHRIPLALGGSNNESNLRVLCRTHNLLAAKSYGLKSAPNLRDFRHR